MNSTRTPSAAGSMSYMGALKAASISESLDTGIDIVLRERITLLHGDQIP